MAAREVRARARRAEESSGTPTKPTATAPRAAGPGLRPAEPAVVEQGTGRSSREGQAAEGAVRSEWADREAAELARRIEAAVGSAGETLRTGPEHAADQLGAHREQMEEAARRGEEAARREEEARELPGAAALGLELAIGALRLVRSLAFAPLRLGLAFLRRGDATA